MGVVPSEIAFFILLQPPVKVNALHDLTSQEAYYYGYLHIFLRKSYFYKTYKTIIDVYQFANYKIIAHTSICYIYRYSEAYSLLII